MAKISVTAYWLEIQASSAEPAFIDLLEHVSGIYATRRHDVYRCSVHLLPEVLFYLRGIRDYTELPVGSAARDHLRIEVTRRKETARLKRVGAPEGQYPGLWSHQQLGVALAYLNPRFNFFYDTRTGKTRMAYAIMEQALREGHAKRCIVITPSTIIKSWLKDAEAFPNLKVVAFYGDGKDKLSALYTPCHIILWSTGMVTKYMDLLNSIKFDICFFDESSKMKSHRSQISKAMLDFCLHVPRWYNLSATPAPNGEYEYYIQMQTVDPYAFNPFITHFESRYFINTSRSAKYKVLHINPTMKDEFMKIVERSSIYVDQAVMPTAGKEWHTVPFNLSATVWSAYEAMRKDLATVASETMITAETAVAMRAKLCQITSSFVLDTDAIKQNKIMKKLGEKADAQEIYSLESFTGNKRISALYNLLVTIGLAEQVVIWAHYEQEFNDIAQLLESQGLTFSILKGGSSIKEKEEAIAGFKSHSIQYLICHPLSVGMGINLTEANNSIYYRTTDSWEALKQSSERIAGHIAVQPKKCHYWVLLAKGTAGEDTVDSLVYNNVTQKRDASTGFLDYLKAGVLRD